MRIYLDNCSIQRPLDDKSQVRIALEAEAVLSIITLSQQRKVELIHSDALEYEIDRTPNAQRKLFAAEVLQNTTLRIPFTEAVITRAKDLEQFGLKPLDALHFASAEAAKAQYFCTCDDRFIKRLRMLPKSTLTVVTPLELIQEVVS